MPQALTFSQEDLIAEIQATERYLKSLKDVLDALNSGNRVRPSITAFASYSDVKVWKCVRNYLAELQRAATLNELANALSNTGVPLGKYPVRTVSTSVAKMDGKNVFITEKRDGQTFVRLADPRAVSAA